MNTKACKIEVTELNVCTETKNHNHDPKTIKIYDLYDLNYVIERKDEFLLSVSESDTPYYTISELKKSG